jgi:signal transduction histidine kinase/ligand-binding sensor domain-containing protein/CheY-like chemotaxis protein/AraC-like DNA-binding protein
MKKIAISVLFLLLCSLVYAQHTNLKFENLSTIDGLSSSTCVEIFQDSDGFLWFGTIDGLNKYDGYDFTVYRSVINDPYSISSNRISTIAGDKQGRLWIGTSNGLNVFDKNTEKFFRINTNPDNPNSISSDLIYGLLFDEAKNTLWIATKRGVSKLALDGIDLSHPEDLKFIRYANNKSDPETLDNNEATSILKDNEHTIWVGTAGKSLNRYDPKTDKFKRVPITISNPYEMDHIPKVILIDHEGDFWIGNNLSGLIVWDRQKNTFSVRSLLTKSVPVFQIYQDKKGMIWFATDGHGIYFLDKTKGIVDHIVHNPSDPFSISNNQPSRILEDKSGIIWIATYNTGVNKLALSKSAFGHFFHQPGNPNSLSHKIAQSIIEDNAGRIWIGTDGGGLNLFDEKTNSFTHFKNVPGDPTSLSGDKIVYVCEGHDAIWICTWDGGLNKLNPATKKFTRYKHNAADPFSIRQNSVWCAVEDKLHRLWIGTQSAGLNLFDPATQRFYQYANNPQDPGSLVNNFVVSLFIDSKNRLFAGTGTGLSMVDLNAMQSTFPEKLSFRNFKEKSLLGNRINYITEDRSGNIWVGSDLGLNKLSGSLKLLATYTTIDGLPNNLITAIKEDDLGNLWLTTKSGLSRLDPLTSKFQNFNTHDGLQGMEFQSKSIDKAKDGRILIGGINGFNIFHPERILADSAKPPLLLTDFKIFHKSVKAYDTINKRVILKESIFKTKAITLRYDEDYISFEFLALSYDNPEKNRYAYRMAGLDKDWNYVGNKRSASYSNLAPGDYTFEVMASNDGTWDDNRIALAISILPPPWKTWWAYSLYTIIIAVLVWTGMRYYTRRVREEKEHELDQMKLMFFINVSHEFRTPLTLILNPIDKILSAFANPEEVKASALTIQRSARRLLNLVNQLLDFRKTDLGKAPLETVHADIVQFSRDIFLLFNDLAEVKKIDFRFESNTEALKTWFDPDKIEKILTNLLSNAIKFTDQNGVVVLSVNKVSQPEKKNLRGIVSARNVKEYVELKVSDSGIGLKKEQLKHVFERFFHVDNSKTGTGIGLHFTKTLVELHHGEITVDSEYGKGSTFTVSIPLHEKRNRPGKDQASSLDKHNFDANAIKAIEYELAINGGVDEEAVPEGNTENGVERKPVVLIVEDNKELRVHLKNELRNHFKVREAVNGVDGFEKILKYYPDIVISDIMMPEMDGFELCRKVKTEIETCHIPVVLLTARSLEEDKIEGYKTGADEYLPKPFNIHVLKARLKNLLESRQRLKEKFMSTGGVLVAKEVTTNTLDEAFLEKVTKVIIENISDPDFSLENLLEKVGISRSHFFRKINSLTGQNPSNFIRTVRLKYAAGLLLQKQHSIKEISYMAGFNSSAYFSKTFRELFGKTPQQYIEDHLPEKSSEASQPL